MKKDFEFHGLAFLRSSPRGLGGKRRANRTNDAGGLPAAYLGARDLFSFRFFHTSQSTGGVATIAITMTVIS